MSEKRCRGYTVTTPADTAFIQGTVLTWQDSVIPESIGFCRKWGSLDVLVTFETDFPLYNSPGTNIGRSSGQSWEGFGPGYRGAAIPARVAVQLGLVTSDAVANFESGGATREELSEELVSGERLAQRQHRARIEEMKKEDEERLSFANAYGETLGEWGAGVVNFGGRIFGKTVGAFLGNLGPYGALALGVVVVGGGAYLLTQSKIITGATGKR